MKINQEDVDLIASEMERQGLAERKLREHLATLQTLVTLVSE